MGVETEFWKSRLNTPAYRLGEAASYSGLSPSTVSAWEKRGRRIGRPNTKTVKPVVAERESGKALTFLQLIEIAVVSELRKLGVKLDRIARARNYFASVLNSENPFVLESFKSDGVNILLDMKDSDGRILKDRLIVTDDSGQLIWTDMLTNSLREFNYLDGMVSKWFLNGVKSEVVIDPQICFGSPSIRGILTRAIKNEWSTGQSLDEISEDYNLPVSAVSEALLFEKVIL